jgi:MFS transporter, CP family, cyanate transporter
MTGSDRLPLCAGRSLAFLRILLVALNLRTAVSSISPIASQIAVDIPLDNTGSVSSAWCHR